MAKRASRSPVERTSAAIPSRTPASPLQSQGGRRPVASVAAVMPPAPADGPQGAGSRTRSRVQSEPKRNRWRHREGRGRDLEAGLLLPVRCRPGSHQGPGRGRSRDPEPLELRCERSPSGRRAGVRQGLRPHPEKTVVSPGVALPGWASLLSSTRQPVIKTFARSKFWPPFLRGGLPKSIKKGLVSCHSSSVG